jgi:hypothetical protein
MATAQLPAHPSSSRAQPDSPPRTPTSMAGELSLSLRRRAPPPPLCSLAPDRSSLAHRCFSLCAAASLSPSSLSHGAPLSLSSFPSRALWSTPARASSHGVQSLAPQLGYRPWRLPLLGTASSSLCRAPCSLLLLAGAPPWSSPATPDILSVRARPCVNPVVAPVSCSRVSPAHYSAGRSSLPARSLR